MCQLSLLLKRFHVQYPVRVRPDAKQRQVSLIYCLRLIKQKVVGDAACVNVSLWCNVCRKRVCLEPLEQATSPAADGRIVQQQFEAHFNVKTSCAIALNEQHFFDTSRFTSLSGWNTAFCRPSKASRKWLVETVCEQLWVHPEKTIFSESIQRKPSS